MSTKTGRKWPSHDSVRSQYRRFPRMRLRLARVHIVSMLCRRFLIVTFNYMSSRSLFPSYFSGHSGNSLHKFNLLSFSISCLVPSRTLVAFELTPSRFSCILPCILRGDFVYLLLKFDSTFFVTFNLL